MNNGQTIIQLLKFHAEKNPNAPAILAPGRNPLSYQMLYRQVQETAGNLNALGITRNDRVGIVLPNGPEMVTAFLGVASTATSAPINPGYKAGDFEFYLTDLGAKALIILKGDQSPAIEVALKNNIPVIELLVDRSEEAGRFSTSIIKKKDSLKTIFAMPEDVALVLHTSGTTSRPKIVPLTQTNICISAKNIKTTLQLTQKDRCLNVMPLFHIHGLMAAVLASIAAGASIVCTPGFHSDNFFDWMYHFQPTWYTAVPTMHQAILAKVQSKPEITAGINLRFMRSSSASLPPQVMKDLEKVFNAPMIEAYGMTEASHQMASNPLPPLKRKPGTVGHAAGPEVKIMDDSGNILDAGLTGEIVIRGENVTKGYEKNSEANNSAFKNKWFRTGDEGILDEEGYLTITGRLKEMINRGGEKITPREVDEVLLSHPAVIQAVAFAIPHKTLGEDLAIAIVLKENADVTEKELRDYAFSKLAGHKVPSQVVIVNKIPKGPTGKLQRIGLADKLSAYLDSEFIPPTNTLETALSDIWKKILQQDKIGIHDNFFGLGGDSLSAMTVISETEKLLGIQLKPEMLFRAPTIDQFKTILQKTNSDDKSFLLPVKPGGRRSPIFLVPGHGGDVFTYVHVTRHLDPDQPVYVFRFPDAAKADDKVANRMVWEMATDYINEMKKIQPEGPYLIGGFCFGGEVALEMAQQLKADGQKIALLAMIFVPLESSNRDIKKSLKPRAIRIYKRGFKENMKRLLNYPIKNIKSAILIQKQSSLKPQYKPSYFTGKITYFDPADNPKGETFKDWKGLTDELEVFSIPGDRYTIFKEPNADVLADKLNDVLEKTVSLWEMKEM